MTTLEMLLDFSSICVSNDQEKILLHWFSSAPLRDRIVDRDRLSNLQVWLYIFCIDQRKQKLGNTPTKHFLTARK